MRSRLASRSARSALLAALVLFSACKDAVTPDNPTPGIDALDPVEVEQGTAELTLTVRGSDFVQGSVMRYNASDRPTQFVSRTELRATLAAEDFSNAGVAQIVVVNPPPGGGTSNVAQLTVRGRGNPIPHITAFSPEHVAAGSGATTVTVTGVGFLEQSRVVVGNTQRETTYVSATQLRINLSEQELAAGGVLPIRVVNPSPGGGVSEPVNFEVRSPAPAITSLSHTQSIAGEPSLTLRVTGTGFLANSAVHFNGVARATQRVSSGVLEAVLAEADLRAAGTHAITVRNPPPGGGTSNSLPFLLVHAAPELTLLPSRGASAGRPGFTLIVHGSGFAEGSVVRWNGSDRTTQFITGTRLAVTITTADVAAPGSAQITVHNPAPGGGTSAAAALTVRAVPPATVTSSQQVALRARDLAYDPQTARLYASVPTGADPHANTVVALDPLTGGITGSVFVGSDPGRMARSDNGQYLYVGLNGANAVRRVELATLTPGLQWPLPAGQVAGDLEVAPGQPGVVAVSRHRPGFSPPLDGVTIYDNGMARPQSSPGHTGGARIEFLESPSTLYGFNNSHSGFEFFTIGIDANGARHVAETRGLISGYYTDIVGASGRIYGTDGSVVDAERRVRVGSFGASSSALLVDPTIGRAFAVTETGLFVYDLNTFQHLGTIPVTGFNFGHPALARTRLVRWGADGLALQDENRVYLIRSPIVAH